MGDPKYLMTKDLLKRLDRIEEIALKLEKHIEENNKQHEEFVDEFKELGKFYKRYSAAKKRFDGE